MEHVSEGPMGRLEKLVKFAHGILTDQMEVNLVCAGNVVWGTPKQQSAREFDEALEQLRAEYQKNLAGIESRSEEREHGQEQRDTINPSEVSRVAAVMRALLECQEIKCTYSKQVLKIVDPLGGVRNPEFRISEDVKNKQTIGKTVAEFLCHDISGDGAVYFGSGSTVYSVAQQLLLYTPRKARRVYTTNIALVGLWCELSSKQRAELGIAAVNIPSGEVSLQNYRYNVIAPDSSRPPTVIFGADGVRLTRKEKLEIFARDATTHLVNQGYIDEASCVVCCLSPKKIRDNKAPDSGHNFKFSEDIGSIRKVFVTCEDAGKTEENKVLGKLRDKGWIVVRSFDEWKRLWDRKSDGEER